MANQIGQGTHIAQTLTMNTKMQQELGRAVEKTDMEMLKDIDNFMEENPAIEKRTDDNAINDTNEDGSKTETSAEIERGNYMDDDERPIFMPRYNASNRSADDDYYTPEAQYEISLSEHLLNQLNERELSDHEKLIAEHIVGNLDSNGYLQRSTRAIADDVTFNEGVDTETEQVDHVLRMVQQLDPPGIGASNLRECLLLQLEGGNSDDERLAQLILANYFTDLSRLNIPRLAQQLKVSEDRVKQVIDNIIRKKLNPKPGSAYSSGTSEGHILQINPDFIVEVADDKLNLTLSNRIPELTIAESYDRMITKIKDTPSPSAQAQKDYPVLKNQYDSARFFINVLKQRQSTLFEVAKIIVNHQKEYFFTGEVSALRPLTQQNVADEMGRDVSLVSRALTNKYIDTPWGVKSMKFFFTEGIMREVDGKVIEVSTVEVKEELKHLIENETQPLSDQRLCDELNKQGYRISRRTITKYREELGIPSSDLRKRLK